MKEKTIKKIIERSATRYKSEIAEQSEYEMTYGTVELTDKDKNAIMIIAENIILERNKGVLSSDEAIAMNKYFEMIIK